FLPYSPIVRLLLQTSNYYSTYIKKSLSNYKTNGNIFKCRRELMNKYGWLAQLAEQRTLNPWVQGSIPWPPIIFFVRDKMLILSLFLFLKLDLERAFLVK